MAQREPQPIDKADAAGRRRRIAEIAHDLGFQGRVEYRHVYSQSGGAQYCVGPTGDADLIVVYAEAFERDRDPRDFSLEAIIAHECGHQHLLRDRDLAPITARLSGSMYEEILASLIGSLLVGRARDAEHLTWKAAHDLATVGLAPDDIVRTLEQLRAVLKEVMSL
jgi:hypothetical protein